MDAKELMESIDIVEYLSQYVQLEQRGEEWWGLSPFKDEKTPSFSVRPETGRFFDFSSGIGGNALTFTKYYFGCTGREAYERLADYAGLTPDQIEKRRKLSATSVCRQFSELCDAKKAASPTILSPDIMLRYDENPGKLKIWTDEGISPEILRKFEVKYDPFSDAIVYPIRDFDGSIVNIGARTLKPDWKEKGLRKYSYYYKWGGSMNVIYGAHENLDAIRSKKEIILFEGCKSVLKAASFGVENCGALLTSHLNPGQMRLLIRLGCNVTFALDKEVNIRKDHNIAKLLRYANVFYFYDRDGLLDEKDSPADRGVEVFQKLYEGRLRYR